MRLSSLVVAVILLSSSTVFAQHSSSSSPPSAPPSPPPSAAPSPAPAPAPSPAPSVSSSASSSSSVSHSSAPSSPSPSPSYTSSPSPSAPAVGGHSADPTPAPSHVPNSSVSPTPSAGSMTSRPAAHLPESESGRVVLERKLPGDEGKMVPSPRIGTAPEHGLKAAEPDLRRRICADGPCKETPPQPAPAESDLRKRICKDGPCVECPPGQAAGKNGTCTAAIPRQAYTRDQCAANETWNGSACVATDSCQPNQYWNGVQCVTRNDDCASMTARAATLANEIRGIKADIQSACSSNPSGQQCTNAKQSYDGAILRYRMLMNEAPVACRSMLPDPLSI